MVWTSRSVRFRRGAPDHHQSSRVASKQRRRPVKPEVVRASRTPGAPHDASPRRVDRAQPSEGRAGSSNLPGETILRDATGSQPACLAGETGSIPVRRAALAQLPAEQPLYKRPGPVRHRTPVRAPGGTGRRRRPKNGRRLCGFESRGAHARVSQQAEEAVRDAVQCGFKSRSVHHARVSQPAEDAGSDPVCCRCKSCPWYDGRVAQR